MNERMITIPYEEYKELQTFKEIAQKSEDRILSRMRLILMGTITIGGRFIQRMTM